MHPVPVFMLCRVSETPAHFLYTAYALYIYVYIYMYKMICAERGSNTFFRKVYLSTRLGLHAFRSHVLDSFQKKFIRRHFVSLTGRKIGVLMVFECFSFISSVIFTFSHFQPEIINVRMSTTQLFCLLFCTGTNSFILP